LLQQLVRDLDVDRGNRVRIMSFGADAVTLAGGSPAATPGLILLEPRDGLAKRRPARLSVGSLELAHVGFGCAGRSRNSCEPRRECRSDGGASK
jgi:hypothetical protein